jgi:hypothetical protein
LNTLVALHDHRVVLAQGPVVIPPEFLRQNADDVELDRGEGGIWHHHQPLVFRVGQIGPDFRPVLLGHLVGPDRHAEQRDALGDPVALRVLGTLDHLVKTFRLEGDEHALLGEAVGGRRVRHGHDVGAGLTRLVLLHEPAQHRLAAGSQQRHLDSGVLGEPVGKSLHQRERRRCVPAHHAFLDRGRAVGLIRLEGLGGGRRHRHEANEDGRQQRGATAQDFHGLPPAILT